MRWRCWSSSRGLEEISPAISHIRIPPRSTSEGLAVAPGGKSLLRTGPGSVGEAIGLEFSLLEEVPGIGPESTGKLGGQEILLYVDTTASNPFERPRREEGERARRVV